MSTPGTEAETPLDATPADATLLEAALIELRAELDAAKQEQIRAFAEVENQRKRLARDADAQRRYAGEKLIGDLLPVADTLDAGITLAGDDVKRLREGFELTRRQFLKSLEGHGVSVIDPVGAAFDPEWHQAMSVVDAPNHAPGSVVSVLQKGYRLHDRLLRPALVAVARDPDG